MKAFVLALLGFVVFLHPFTNRSLAACAGTNTIAVCDEAGLRAAITIGGEVRFCCSGTITLTNTIEVTVDVTLDASGQSVALSGGNTVRLFNVSTGVTFIVSNLALVNGRNRGTNGANLSGPTSPARPGQEGVAGAILNRGGTVRLYSCLLSNNAAIGGQGGNGDITFPQFHGPGGFARGGAIVNAGGVVVFAQVTAVNNSAIGGASGPGGPGGFGASGHGLGGAVYNAGSLLVSDSFFYGNSCVSAPAHNTYLGLAAGGGIFQSNGVTTISNSTFQACSVFGGSVSSSTPASSKGADAKGGAVYFEGGEQLIYRAHFAQNLARAGDSVGAQNPGSAAGGAIFSRGVFRLESSSISSNQAVAGDGNFTAIYPAYGGGFYNQGTAVVSRVVVSDNLSQGGRGRGSIVGYPGADGVGGGIYNGGALFVTNATVAQNMAQGGNGGNLTGTAGRALGGGIFSTGTIALVNVTIATNRVFPGLGSTRYSAGANLGMTNAAVTTLRNSLLAYPNTNGNVSGPIVDDGFNLSSDGSANFTQASSLNSTNPKLGNLANNGGPTLTMALLSGSPAIDTGTASGAPATDQRGVARPAGAGVDIGAFEVATLYPSLTGWRAGGVLNLAFNGEAGLNYRIEHSSNLVSWTLKELTGTISTNGVVVRTNTLTQPLEYFRVLLDF